MVKRKLNTCILYINKFPVAWLRQIGAEWSCHICGEKKEKGTVSFEITLMRRNTDAVKAYLCLTCAAEMLDETADEVRKCDELGAEAYNVFRRL